MARPKKGEEKHRPCQMAFRASEAVRKAVVGAAKAQKKSISDVINEVLERSLVNNPHV